MIKFGVETKMKWLLKIAAAACVVCYAPHVMAAPLAQSLQSPTMIEEIKIVCHPDGMCEQMPARRPVARWIYGNGNFYGPYDGPRNYGNPRLHYGILPYWWW